MRVEISPRKWISIADRVAPEATLVVLLAIMVIAPRVTLFGLLAIMIHACYWAWVRRKR